MIIKKHMWFLHNIKQINCGSCRNIKQINIKNHAYYFFKDMINIKDFDSSLIKKQTKNPTKILTFIILVTSQ